MALPEWKVSRLKPGQLGIQCPRKECEGKAVVNRAQWLRGNEFKTRPCTYCFKTSSIPSSFRK